jgi:phosphoglucomutase
VEFNNVPSDMIAYQGQFRQLVAESNVDTPNSGFYVGDTFITGNSAGNDGVHIDYQNGRILFPKLSGTGMTISGLSTVKEVNTYIAHDNEADFIMHSDFIEDGTGTDPYLYKKEKPLDETTYFLPACFVSLASSSNEEFAFGGEENTETRVRVMVLTKDSYILDSVISRLRDTAREQITHIPYEEFPYGYSYSIKNFPYKYDTLKASQSNPMTSHIDKVSVSKVVSESIREELNRNFSIGFIDFDLSTYRFPRL